MITHTTTKRTYIFNCGQWLATDEGDGSISRVLTPTHSGGDAAVEYQVCSAWVRAY
jgi:hypothetical protein